MRALLLFALAALAACGDPAAPPPSGLLRVSIGTLGDDPDPDGYLLRVDEADAVPADLNGITDFDLAPGRHQLTLDGLASHCSIESGTSRAVEIAPDDMTIVTLEISCPLTGARISVSTSGLDLDASGYVVEVDDSVRGSLGPGLFLLHLEPGEHTIALTGLAPNCTAEEPSRSVTVVPGNAATIEFAVVCTAATGVIRLVVTGVGMDQEGSFRAIVDGRSHYISYLLPNDIRVLPGTHTISVDSPDDCATNTPPQMVTVTGGGLVRDTVRVSFGVTCVSPVGPGVLAFTATQHNLARVAADGSQYADLTTPEPGQYDGAAAWSPGGERLAFARESPGHISIYLIERDGTNLVRLSPSEALDYGPAWSPDGRRIAFVNITPGRYASDAWQVYLMNADGSHRVRLTSLAGGAGAPTWSPDGKRIAFMGDAGVDRPNIYVVNQDGTQLKRLTNGTDRYFNPAWSPDGGHIVFSNADALGIIDADGNHPRRLTSPPAERWSYHDDTPAWSPDGMRIIFSRQYDCDPFGDGGPSCKPAELRMIELNGDPLATILVSHGWDPAWGP